jgi:hypothetical protein
VNRRRQGDLGELSALYWLASKGVPVALPIGHSPDWDLAAEIMGRLVRVQVKTCSYARGDRWAVTLATRGGNQSWSGLTKRFDPTRCEYLFVHVGDGRRWFIPSTHVQGGTHILLGGPRYAAFEIDRGEALG